MLRRLIQTVLAVAALATVASVAAAAHSFGGGGGTGKFAASFEARAITDGTITSCRGLGLEGQKIEGSYQGTMSVDGEEFAFNFTTLEILFDRSTGVGTADGNWQAQVPDGPEIVARGELLAVVTGDPPGEIEPPDPDLELHGLLIGYVNPPDPDMPAQRLLGNFTASLRKGWTFPHLKGTVGDPSVGDPSVGDPTNPAVLLPAVKC